MKTNINLSTLAGGAVGERINIELQKVAENVRTRIPTGRRPAR